MADGGDKVVLRRGPFTVLGRLAQAIDTTTPMGKLVFQVTGAFAECCFYNKAIRYRTLHATIASGRVRLATDGGAKIAR